jgi:3-phenylpropionate/trans-cinnamate dioxygenase ferredoxin reductase component
MTSDSVVIVGAGHAGGQCAVCLRQLGHEGSITIIGEEAYPPYERPPLSKAYLAGELADERLFLRKLEFWTEKQIDLQLNETVTGVDAVGKTVSLASGKKVPYGKLVLATGGRIRPLPGLDPALAGVHYLRGIADVDGLRASLKPGARLAIIGGGYIGLEVAAVARKLGHAVTVIEAMDRLLQRVTSPVISAFYAALHRGHGVDLRLGCGVAGLEGSDHVTGVCLADGSVIAADVVLIGIGILPNLELASGAGLETGNGIVVDRQCRTSDPSIFAIGDVAWHPNSYSASGMMRLESVQNAVDQAKIAAQQILGQESQYDEVPWFWSDQYDVKLQSVGLSTGYDDLGIRGDASAAGFSVLYWREGRLIAIDAVSAIKDFMAGKKLVQQGVRLDKEAACNVATPLKELIPPA